MDMISGYIRADMPAQACIMGLMPTQPALSRDILTAALAGMEAQQKAIDEHIAIVRSMLGTEPKRRGRPPKQAQPADAQPAEIPRKRRKMSAEARRRIAEAARKRWAAARKAGRTRLG